MSEGTHWHVKLYDPEKPKEGKEGTVEIVEVSNRQLFRCTDQTKDFKRFHEGGRIEHVSQHRMFRELKDAITCGLWAEFGEDNWDAMHWNRVRRPIEFGFKIKVIPLEK